MVLKSRRAPPRDAARPRWPDPLEVRLAAGLVAPLPKTRLFASDVYEEAFTPLTISALAAEVVEHLLQVLNTPVVVVGLAVAVLVVPAVHRRGPGKVPGIVLRRRPAVAVGRLAGLGNDRPAGLAEADRHAWAAAVMAIAKRDRPPDGPHIRLR